MKFLNFLLPLLLLALFGSPAAAQSSDLIQQLWKTYPQFKEESLTQRRIKHQALQPLIEKYKQQPGFNVHQVGRQIFKFDVHRYRKNRRISLVSNARR